MTATRRWVCLTLALMVAAAPALAQTRPNAIGRNADIIGERAVPRAWQDGIVVNQFDDRISRQTFWSDGRSATQFGSIVIYNDGTMATRLGDRTIFGNGRSCGQIGAATLCD